MTASTPDAGASGHGSATGPPTRSGAGRRWHVDRLSVMAGLIVLALFLYDLLFFQLGTYRLPIYDTANYYDKGSLLLVWLGNVIPGLPEWLDRSPLQSSADWTAMSHRNTVAWISGQGPGYPFFLMVVQLLVGEGYAWSWVGNAVLHAIAALLVFGIARRVAGRRVALLALALYAANVSGTVVASQLLSENLCVVLILGAVYLLLRTRDVAGGKWWLMVGVSGALLAMLALTRPAYFPFAGLSLLGASAWVWMGSRVQKIPLKWWAVPMLVAGFMGPYVAWQTQLHQAFQPDHLLWKPHRDRDITPSLRESYDLANGGWPKPSLVGGETSGRAWVQPPSMWESIRADPFDSAVLRADKVFRLWHSPVSVFANPPWPGLGFSKWLHGVLIVGGLLGACLLRPWATRLLLVWPVAYTTVIYVGYFSEEQRFVFPVMGLVTVLCAIALAHAARTFRTHIQPRLRTAGGWWWTAALAASGLLWVLPEDGFTWMGVDPQILHGLGVTGFAVAVLVVCWGLAGWVSGPSAARQRWAVLALYVVLLAVPLVVHKGAYTDWYSWRTVLSNPAQRISHEIRLPAHLSWDQVANATLQLDVRDADGQLDNVDLRLNGTPLRNPDKPESGGGFIFMMDMMGPLRAHTDWRDGDLVPGLHQWLIYGISPEQLREGRIVVDIRLKQATTSPREFFTLYGSLPVAGPQAGVQIAPGPRPQVQHRYVNQLVEPYLFTGRASLWRYQSTGDARIHGGTPLVGTHRSTYIPNAWQSDPVTHLPGNDLSDAPFTQTGAFRIRLQLITHDGREWIL